MTNEKKWLVKYYEGAIGFKIVGATISPDGFPQLICRRGRGKTGEEIKLEVSQDEEGNGAGFLFGLPVPESEPKAEADPFKDVPEGRNPDDLPDDLLADILNKRKTQAEAWKAYDFRKGLDEIHESTSGFFTDKEGVK